LRASGTWSPTDVFAEVAEKLEDVDTHHRMLRSYARHDYSLIPEALDLRGDELVIDAGGGLGALARGILDLHPGASVVLLERPEVVDVLRQQGLAVERLQPRTANLFEPWPVQGDAVVLARVLHDWDDDGAIQILKNAREALGQDGVLYVVEMVLRDGGMAGGLCDLHLLMATGGQERTEKEFRALFEAGGFMLTEVCDLPALPSVLVGVAR